MRIAVCDDCAEDALFLERCLAGHEVSVYFGADSLLADLHDKNTRYDLYLLDIFMENSMNGIELAEQLRRLQDEAVICFISTSDAFYREAYDLYAISLIWSVRCAGRSSCAATRALLSTCTMRRGSPARS